MEQNVLTLLQTIGYEIIEDNFQEALTNAPKSTEYSKIIHFITNELRSLCSIDEEVNILEVPEDYVCFLMEINSFLKEIGCPHTSLTHGNMDERLTSMDDKLLLVDYLTSKLLFARMQHDQESDPNLIIKVKETPEARNIQAILNTLECKPETKNLPLKEILDILTLKLESVVTECGEDLIPKPIWNHQLTVLQWDAVRNIQQTLHDEYTIRRKMMLQRLDCTIQSFQWSSQIKGKNELLMQTYVEKRKQLKVEPDVNISSLLAAREDLAVMEKTSSSSVRKNTQCNVNKVLIGQVPDRGGRATEHAPPPPEMPSWQTRQASGGGGQRGGRGGGRRGSNQGGHRGQQASGYNSDYRQQSQSFDSAGPYTTSYQGNSNSYQQNSSNQRYEEQFHSKRPKTYDSFQAQRQTYADQYVQESQYNQQYQPRHNRGGGGGGGRGRSNYHRGGRGGGGYNQGQSYY